MREFGYEIRPISKEIVSWLREAASYVVAYQFAFLRIRVAGPALQTICIGDHPEIIVLKTPKRIFGMDALAWRTKFSEKTPEPLVNLPKGKQPTVIVVASSESVKEKQRLVGRPLISPLPDGQVSKSSTEFVWSHGS